MAACREGAASFGFYALWRVPVRLTAPGGPHQHHSLKRDKARGRFGRALFQRGTHPYPV